VPFDAKLQGQDFGYDTTHICDFAFATAKVYFMSDFGRAEDRFLRSDPEEEESPNTIGRDAA
jgi:hypothetical protein